MTRAHLALVGVVVVWAGSFSAIKAALDEGVAAIDIAILRYASRRPGSRSSCGGLVDCPG